MQYVVQQHRVGGFNRTILECKGTSEFKPSFVPGDLIEPYWNVKEEALEAAKLVNGI